MKSSCSFAARAMVVAATHVVARQKVKLQVHQISAAIEASTAAQKNSSASARLPNASCSGEIATSAAATSAVRSLYLSRAIHHVSATVTMPAIAESVASA